jgi:hypothetical protein
VSPRNEALAHWIAWQSAVLEGKDPERERQHAEGFATALAAASSLETAIEYLREEAKRHIDEGNADSSRIRLTEGILLHDALVQLLVSSGKQKQAMEHCETVANQLQDKRRSYDKSGFKQEGPVNAFLAERFLKESLEIAATLPEAEKLRREVVSRQRNRGHYQLATFAEGGQ